MAITFAKATLAALEALLKRVFAEVMAPIQQKLDSLSGVTLPPVITPDPTPQPQPEPQAETDPCAIPF